ncbi:hypothetical protein NKH77_55985 [Streptomyces sp. M19]
MVKKHGKKQREEPFAPYRSRPLGGGRQHPPPARAAAGHGDSGGPPAPRGPGPRHRPRRPPRRRLPRRLPAVPEDAGAETPCGGTADPHRAGRGRLRDVAHRGEPRLARHPGVGAAGRAGKTDASAAAEALAAVEAMDDAAASDLLEDALDHWAMGGASRRRSPAWSRPTTPSAPPG